MHNNIVPETFWKVVCGKHLWYIIYENKIFVCSGTLSLYGINIFGITLLDILKLAHGIWIRNPYVSMYPEYTFVQKISPLFECNFILKTFTNLCVLSNHFTNIVLQLIVLTLFNKFFLPSYETYLKLYNSDILTKLSIPLNLTDSKRHILTVLILILIADIYESLWLAPWKSYYEM